MVNSHGWMLNQDESRNFWFPECGDAQMAAPNLKIIWKIGTYEEQYLNATEKREL